LIVGTDVADMPVDGYPLVLRHERVAFVSFPFEWSALALREAALHILRLAAELAKHGLALRSMCPHDVLFSGTRPVFVDVGAIERFDDTHLERLAREFQERFLVPLSLMGSNNQFLARSVLRRRVFPVPPFDPVRLVDSNGTFASRVRQRAVHAGARHLPEATKPLARRMLNLYDKKFMGTEARTRDPLGTWRTTIDELSRQVEAIQISIPDAGAYQYYGGFPSLLDSSNWTRKQQDVSRLLSNARPETLLDVGSNVGWFSHLAASRGTRAVAWDISEQSVDCVFADASQRQHDILPLVVDVASPSPSFGFRGTTYPGATDRYRTDCVLALALIHHLVFRQHLDFDRIVSALAQLTNNRLIVEFVEPTDHLLQTFWDRRTSWYTLDNFVHALRKQFRTIQVLPRHNDTRCVIECTKAG
jgi:SAM-dependent methyltransferase